MSRNRGGHLIRQETAAGLLVLVASLLFGISGAVAANAFDEIPPTRVAQARSVIAAGMLLPYALSRGLVRRVPVGRILMLGVNLAAIHIAYYLALQRLGVGPGVTIEFLGPLLVLAWMRFVQHRPVAPGVWVAGAVAVVGAGLVSQAWRFKELDLLGLGAGLAAAVLFASYLLQSESITRHLHPAAVLGLGFLVAATLWSVLYPPWEFPLDVSAGARWQLVWVGLGGTMLPFVLEMGAMRHISAGSAGVIATSEPVFAAAAAWVLLSQSLSPLQVVGGMAVVAAVATTQRIGTPSLKLPMEAAH